MDQTQDTLFRLIPSNQSGIQFQNTIKESSERNILDYEYLYNGAGVGVGDFNNDGKPDIYFAGNMTGNRLYLNEGDLTFKDVTTLSATEGATDKWYSGVAVVDINGDGWLDIYICATGRDEPSQRRNELYINKGLNEQGVPVFTEQAEKYGLAHTSYSTQAAFFDYDNDGDLDMYLLVSYPYSGGSYTNILSQREDVKRSNTDKLFRADWDSSRGYPVYTDVSETAGIIKSGYSLGINIADINNDGWKDIYVANDYITNDLFWVNNGDGTFTDRAGEYFKHTSYAAMGTDIADINNDGLLDIFTLDMLAEVNVRRKTMMNPNNYRSYVNNTFAGYDPQFTRNTLQLNLGPVDSTGRPIFSEIAFLAGIAATDWSWAPLIADFDNDGYRDIFITNGIPKDPTDKDFWDRYRSIRSSGLQQAGTLDLMPEVKISNYIFRNNGNLTFADSTESWGMVAPTFSTGAAYADFDNDGDLDLVINNINEPAFLYENQLNKQSTNWLKIKFKRGGFKSQALGARVNLYYSDSKQQIWEHTLYRGYLSSVEEIAHFGLGDITKVDSVVVTWPGNPVERQKVWENIQANRVLTVEIPKTLPDDKRVTSETRKKALFKDVTGNQNIRYVHEEREYDDFRLQPLLPHKLSQLGPGLTAGDIDGNGTEDIFIGASSGNRAVFLLQQQDGTFVKTDFQPENEVPNVRREDRGVLLFDADNDGDQDLYIVSGSNENPPGHTAYQDRIYENDGNGQFRFIPDALPDFYASGSVVTASDYNHDGKLDLFVGSRVEPGRYPEPASAYLLRNDSKQDEISFTDVTPNIAPSLDNIGLVTDAQWTDFNNDGWRDLIISGEWMPVTFLENRSGTFADVTVQSGLKEQVGWWNSITAGDFDNDGYMDYVVGNLGLNSLYSANVNEPVSIYAGDLNESGLYESISTIYVRDTDGIRKEFPVHFRQDLEQQFGKALQKFETYDKYGRATIQELLSTEQIGKSAIHRAINMKSSLIKNNADGTFEMMPLPIEAQFAPIFGMVADDFDNDGNLDLLLHGNQHKVDPQIGSYDALNGLLLKGNGGGNFTPLSIAESGVYIPGDGKALIKLSGTDGRYFIAASQNQGPLRLFEKQSPIKALALQPHDSYAIIYFEDGTVRKEEFHYGTSFLSASGRFLVLTSQVESIEIFDYYGNRRKISVRK